jgi:ATP-dependent DNA helicase RecQ
LPTGGGKSICFHVPGLFFDGITIVISPLISLMEDQVYNLKSKGIKAAAIHSGLSSLEIESLYNQCEHLKIKFLYISPERLLSKDFQLRSKLFNISLIAIDESHCISQWGYDFRPAYLKISDFINQFPEAKKIALTATAKPRVVEDIITQLKFKNTSIFRSSFERQNLSYHTVSVKNKEAVLNKTLEKYKGSTIVYCYSRKEVKRVCKQLQLLGYSADFYHGGLKTQVRKIKQNKWIEDQTRVMVATNAFGMGIDKPDVRLVVHYDLPENLENYFQEAGRGGRDLKESLAILIFEDADKQTLDERVQSKFVDDKIIRKVYDKVFINAQISLNSGLEEKIEFDILKFAKKYDFELLDVYNSLESLKNCDYLDYQNNDTTQSKIKFTVDNETAYQFQVQNVNYDAFIRYLSRSYPGIFDHHIPFRLEDFSKHLKTSHKRISEQLDFLYKNDIIDYTLQSDNPKIHILKDRIQSKDLNLKNYHFLEGVAKENLKLMTEFLDNSTCRSVYLRNYFGDQTDQRCGKCSYCLKNRKLADDSILELIGDGIDFAELVVKTDLNEKGLIEKMNELIDEGKIRRCPDRFNYLIRC